jgi:DNA polymerase-1
MSPKLFLIDGHSQVFQAYYAIGDLTSPKGLPVNAAFGFVGMLERLLREQKPEYCAVVFDMEGPTFRHKVFKEYKATRKPTPPDLIPQIPVVQQIIKAYRIPTYALSGYEADDVIGTIASQAASKGMEVYIVTTDKDAQQLIGPHVKIWSSRKNQVLDLEWLQKERGLRPEQVVDAMALEGDSIDNVPGIQGVGEKTALELVREWGTLERVLDNAQQVKRPKLRGNLMKGAEAARLSKQLVTIDTQAPVKFSLEEMKYRGPDRDRLIAIFRELGFNKYLADLVPMEPAAETRYRLVNTAEALEALVAGLKGQTVFSLDTETTSAVPVDAQLVGLSFSWKEKEAYYLPLMAPLGEKALSRQAALDALAPVLQDKRIQKIGQNIKFDMIILKNHGVGLEGVAFDTMVAAYLLDPERRRYNLGELALGYLGQKKTPISDLIGEGRNPRSMDTVPLDQICAYSCQDADLALRLAHLMEPKLKDLNLWSLFHDVEMPLIEVLADMERTGVALDKGLLQRMSEELQRDILGFESQIYEAAGERFNISSPKQLAPILFGKLGLQPIRRLKTGPSTDADVLEILAHQHPLPRLIVKYRELSKLKSTYVDALPAMVNPRTGRIHCSFNHTATATGRLSSSEPNLQNIPARTELGRRIRAAFVPSSEDYLLLTADYSQIELRILAHVTGDPALVQAFKEDLDIHAFVASQIYGVPQKDVTEEMRTNAKAVSFGIIYGQTPFGLSRAVGIPVDAAKRFIDAYFARYPRVREFIADTVAEASKNGYVSTLMNRRRYLPGLTQADKVQRAFEERAAVNAVIQGSAADMIKVAMVRIHKALRERGTQAKLLIQIHDELLLEAPQSEIEGVRQLVVREMKSSLPLSVPVKVNSAVGKNWLEAA